MPEYLAPGVYIEEVPSGPVPIEGVSTSTAGFVGQTQRGPTVPAFVSSFTEYRRIFGDPTDIGEPTKANRSYLGFAVQGFFANGGKRAFIARVVGDGANSSSNDDLITGYKIEAVGPGTWGNGVYLGVKAGSLAKAGDGLKTIKLEIAWYAVLPQDNEALDPNIRDKYQAPDAQEVFDNLAIDPNDPNSVEKAVNGVSKLICVSRPDPDTDPTPPQNAVELKSGDKKLAGGTDVGTVSADDYKGKTTANGQAIPPEQFTGLAGIGAIREVSILVVPDHHDGDLNLTDPIVTQCETQKDRFAVLHFTQDQNKDLTGQAVPMDSSYAAIYAPWVRILDPKDPSGRSTLEIPPSGHIAGVYARTDIERGVHKAPANEELRGILLQDRGSKKPLVPVINRGIQEILNPKNINAIRDFRSEGRGIRVWGSRTMSSNGQWRYVPVRRLFMFIEQSVELATQWVVFEPNSEFTWIRVVASVSNFLGTQWRNGALFGATPEEAYFVKCDRTTMTPDDIDNGRLICLVGIAPVKPAEFVIFRFSQKTIEAQG